MFEIQSRLKVTASVVGAMFLSLSLCASTHAAVADVAPVKLTPKCDGNCTWSIDAGGQQVGSGTYFVNSDGTIGIDGAPKVDLGDGSFVSINSLTGNVDPILGFGVSANTTALGNTFAFAFNLPIALSGPIAASSKVSYSLTGTSPAGAQIAPLSGKVVQAFEVDTSVGGLPAVNKGVDVGNTFFFSPGPDTQNSPVYAATSSFVGSFAYDLMSVRISFSLSPNSNVGVSGFVQQLPVPEPSTYALIAAGLAMVGFIARRRITA